MTQHIAFCNINTNDKLMKQLIKTVTTGQQWDSKFQIIAATYGYIDCLRYAHEHGCPWDENTCSAAIKCGQLECLRYAHEHGCPWYNYQIGQTFGNVWNDCCSLAAAYGHLECLRYVHDNGCHWGTKTCRAATTNGHVNCLQYAHEHGCEWNFNEMCNDSAEYNQLTCLQYAHSQGCPWDERTCELAADCGSLACLTYLHENGCPWNERTINIARQYGSRACFQYAIDNQCPSSHDIQFITDCDLSQNQYSIDTLESNIGHLNYKLVVRTQKLTAKFYLDHIYDDSNDGSEDSYLFDEYYFLTHQPHATMEDWDIAYACAYEYIIK